MSELLEPALSDLVEVVGVATDDPVRQFTHANVRLWKYPHTRAEEQLVWMLAQAHGLPVYAGRVQTSEFLELFRESWCPDLCLMATFGQMIPRRIFECPPLGFYNFHHSGPIWPSYPGPDPIAAMQRDGRREVFITMHEVTEILDGGKFVARSQPVALPKEADAAAVHRITWPQMGGFIRRQVQVLVRAQPK